MLLFCVFRGARLDAVMIYKFFSPDSVAGYPRPRRLK
jgi:hypothetical protein